MTNEAILTLVAIVVGPVVAVLITWCLNRKYRADDRKLNIFRDLMQTRGIRLDPLHVAALNIIELEFYKNPKIRKAFKDYIEHLGTPIPEKDSDQKQFFDNRSELLMELLREIGHDVGYTFDKMELDRRSYAPVGWENDQFLQRRNAQLLGAVLSGERPIPVTNFLAPSPFPDPPEIDEPAQ